MSERRLVAVIACRADSSRLYAKPLQNLADGTTILDQKLATLAALGETVSQSVIAIAEGIENLAYIDAAARGQARYLFGSKHDILSRLVSGALLAGATDVLRLTSENPFIWWEALPTAWQRHLAEDNDLTVVDGCPLGSYFEILRLESLLKAHRYAQGYQREACTQYFRDHAEQFRARVITPPESLRRLDVRLTVDNPEDLVVCRQIYQHFQARAPLIPLAEIIDYWDSQPWFLQLLGKHITGKGIWVNNDGCSWAPRS